MHIEYMEDLIFLQKVELQRQRTIIATLNDKLAPYLNAVKESTDRTDSGLFLEIDDIVCLKGNYYRVKSINRDKKTMTLELKG